MIVSLVAPFLGVCEEVQDAFCGDCEVVVKIVISTREEEGRHREWELMLDSVRLLENKVTRFSFEGLCWYSTSPMEIKVMVDT